MQFTTLPVLTEVNPLEVLADWSTASQDRFITQGKKSVDQLLDSAARLAQAIIPKRWFAVISRYIVQANHELDPDGYRYWDQITTFTWLGAMPLENYGHVEKITEIGVKAILSINEEHEFLAGPWSRPVDPEKWKERSIEFLNIPSQDLGVLNAVSLSEAVDYINAHVQQSEPVYVHCNAGQGRSATVMAAYLSAHLGLTVDEAVEHLRARRPQISPKEEQLQEVRLLLGTDVIES